MEDLCRKVQGKTCIHLFSGLLILPRGLEIPIVYLGTIANQMKSTSSSTEPAKSAKPFATQPAQRTQPTEPVTPPSVPAAEQAQPTKASAQTSQTTQHVKLVQSTQADPYKGQVGLLTPSRVKQDESVTPQPIRNTARPTEASLSTQGSIINRDHGPRKPVAEPRADPAADPVAEPVAKSQNDRDRVQIRRHNKPCALSLPSQTDNSLSIHTLYAWFD